MITISINGTTKQKPRLDMNGQSYMKYRSNSTKTYWRCIKYSRDLCHSRLHTCIITNNIIKPPIQYTCKVVEKSLRTKLFFFFLFKEKNYESSNDWYTAAESIVTKCMLKDSIGFCLCVKKNISFFLQRKKV